MTLVGTKAEARGPAKSRGASRCTAGLLRGAWRELAVPAKSRNPFLDGLRALAVLLVINFHVAEGLGRNFGQNAYTRFPLTVSGWMGVDLFFVLSGFFIGSQLWRELAATGTVSFSRFILRRGLRIWPLYFFVFAAVCAQSPARIQHGWTNVTFLSNYLGRGIVAGSWSLSSEEQFYILAPLSLLFFRKHSPTAFRWALGALLLTELGIRMATFYHLTGHIFVRNTDAMAQISLPLHTHCDGLIAGMLVANLVVYTNQIESKNLPWTAIVAGMLLLIAAIAFHFEALNFFALAVAFGGIVWLSTQRVIRIFNGHIFYVLSRLSYGMYLNHEYMRHWVVMHVTPGLLRLHFSHVAAAIGVSLSLICLSAGLSSLTFAIIEHPFLVLRAAMLRRSVPHMVAH